MFNEIDLGSFIERCPFPDQEKTLLEAKKAVLSGSACNPKPSLSHGYELRLYYTSQRGARCLIFAATTSTACTYALLHGAIRSEICAMSVEWRGAILHQLLRAARTYTHVL